MEMGLSFGEILLIAVAIIVLFGPDKIPQIARDLGSATRKMRGAVDDIKSEIMKETDNPVAEIKREIDKVKEAVKNYDPLEQNIKDSKTPSPSSEQNKTDQLNEVYEGPVSRRA